MLAHNVYFTLKEDSAEARGKLIDDCRKYLQDLPGISFFAVGTLVDDLSRPVNDKGFQVGLHVVFENWAAHDAYQIAEEHIQFIAQNKESWQQVRIFDSTDD